jgi:hypothetical protein
VAWLDLGTPEHSPTKLHTHTLSPSHTLSCLWRNLCVRDSCRRLHHICCPDWVRSYTACLSLSWRTELQTTSATDARAPTGTAGTQVRSVCVCASDPGCASVGRYFADCVCACRSLCVCVQKSVCVCAEVCVCVKRCCWPVFTESYRQYEMAPTGISL